MFRKRKMLKRLIWFFVILFILMNIVVNFHAYKFTHFTSNSKAKTKSPDKLSSVEKFKTLLLGVNNPRPLNSQTPAQTYQTVKLQSNKSIECWYIQSPDSLYGETKNGTVILFHGYGGEKSSLIDKSDEFLKLGYNTLLVDFMGSGGSEGNQTSLGFKEAQQVKTAFDYVVSKGERNIYLFGTSMGAVAILKSISDENIQPKGIIIECPFGSMYETVKARFRNMNVPALPMAPLLVFWGGVQNGFWAFGHQPTEYAKKVNCPSLLLYGELDKNVSPQEIDEIYTNLPGAKTLRIYPFAGHENYLIKYKNDWVNDITSFLKSHE